MARFLKNKQASLGAAPGTLIFEGLPQMEHSVLRMVQYNGEFLKENTLRSFRNIKSCISDEQVTWFSLYGLSETGYLEQLEKECAIPSLILEDILNTDERPKMLEDEKHIYIITKAFHFNASTKKTQMEQISLILGRQYLITIQESDHPYFEDINKRLRSGVTKIRNYTPDYLCYTLLDTLVDSYILNIEKLGNHIEQLEERLLTTDQQIIRDIYHYKTELAFIRKNIRPVKELVTRFTASDSELIHPRTFNYLKDLDSLVTQALEALEIYYTMTSDQQNIYNSNINNSVNDIMRVLTVFSAIFIPLTFIVGVYGMNFDYMPELRYPRGYYSLWGIMVLIVIAMLFYFKRKRWF
ncbi:MAG: magnesium/cobalt transporter CorA [Culturomica sp.]|jgi:magnesium transporter|nr:magnesium/cobalt transporter CorA [Culturomica sp.]